MKNDLNLYVQFSKTNDEEQIVEGIATSEDLDSQGEIVKYDAIKAALPDYMKFGNIREMHTHSAVGKAIKAIPDDKKKNLLLTAKVVDPIAWQKVKAGVYNGFSIGGRVLKQVGNEIQGIMLNEISLVDRPANPAALFSLVKFDKTPAEVKALQKDAGVAVDDEASEGGEDDGPAHIEVFRAGYVLNIAGDLCMLYDMYEQNGIDTTEVDQAISLLKDIVAKEMANNPEAAKLHDTLEAFQKKTLTAEERKALKSSDYAYIASKGAKHLPIHDEKNIQDAITRFDDTSFESEDAKRTAAKKIMAAANRTKMEVDQKSSVVSVAKQATFEEVKSFVKSDSWTSGYFDTARKILG